MSNRNCYGRAKFIDRGGWIDYHPTGAPPDVAGPTPWTIVANSPNEHLRSVREWEPGDSQDGVVLTDILPEAWK